jgi:hypothetical protein
MKKRARTFYLVEAVVDDNGVPFLVADAGFPSRRVGVKRAANPPESAEHFAEHFEPHAHVVDASNALHAAHYKLEAAAGTLKILGACQAMTVAEAVTALQPPSTAPSTAPPAAPSVSARLDALAADEAKVVQDRAEIEQLAAHPAPPAAPAPVAA